MSAITPVLSFSDLVQFMEDMHAQAFDPSLRLSNESDAIVLGKLSMLEIIGCKAVTYLLNEADEAAFEFQMLKIEKAIVHLQAAIAAPKSRARKLKP